MKFKNKANLKSPHGNSNVWRYMNDSKFKNLLESSSLYFANAVDLTDKYEVKIPESSLESIRNDFRNAGLKNKELDAEMDKFYWENSPIKENVFLNCWSQTKYESYASAHAYCNVAAARGSQKAMKSLYLN